MANIINLRETEYQIIVSDLSKMHEDQLDSIKKGIHKMKGIVSSNNIFSTNLTSRKMINMLFVLEVDVIPLLQQAFRDSEAGVTNMIKSTMITDSVCD